MNDTVTKKSDPEKLRENRLRRSAERQGFQIRKSRTKHTNIDDYGGYRIVNSFFNTVEAGERFDLTIDDVEKFLNEGVVVY